ncbi:hypothetical protein ADL22_17910 [Streptomyces sp. NRRL F-4489]|uniref:hypothetical protein n=1 Tax=Streptomyces sp. NRRL F-4489 TaxID=1609095 RepID=UPI000749108B|nr:hypothetical protein [Streptomyces sp. NRRL F-4489]KUL38643.1 hypothetical protein ADL22_17910 [Streptomyces sp. NRRL F-4489]
MKQGTAKTLGAVALGAAIAATAAGTASAAPAGNQIDTSGVLHSLPVKDATKTLAGATNTKGGDGNDVKTKLTSKGNKLLGGLPAGMVTKNLPLGG